LDTSKQNKEKEYNKIKNEINKFLNSDINVMLIRFSGREIIVKELGDEYSEMIIALSTNKRSSFYVSEMQKVFCEMTDKYLSKEMK